MQFFNNMPDRECVPIPGPKTDHNSIKFAQPVKRRSHTEGGAEMMRRYNFAGMSSPRADGMRRMSAANHARRLTKDLSQNANPRWSFLNIEPQVHVGVIAL